MFKFLLGFMLSWLCLFAQDSVSKFSETRYINAINKTINLRGEIAFSTNSIKIDYIEPKQSIIYENEVLHITNEKGNKSININSEPIMGYFFMIIKAIHDNDYVLIESYFDMKQTDLSTKLIPKDIAKKYIEEITFTKTNTVLQSLRVITTKKDRIEIEVID
ncbi:MAG: hypothetical protein AB1389_05185 [Campylobacterota bacterium]